MVWPLKIREKNPENEITDLQDWVWPEIDNGVWEGTLENWIKEHQYKWFKHVLEYQVVVQAGGACGMYPRLLSDRFKTVYTFEPHPLSFHCLVQNCQKSNIIKINGALGDRHCMIKNNTVDEGIPNIGGNKTIVDNDSYIPQFMIDDLQLLHCNLIALDVEENEPSVLKGAIKTIEKFKPVIIAENGERQEVIEILVPLGYEKVDKSSSDDIWISTK